MKIAFHHAKNNTQENPEKLLINASGEENIVISKRLIREYQFLTHISHNPTDFQLVVFQLKGAFGDLSLVKLFFFKHPGQLIKLNREASSPSNRLISLKLDQFFFFTH
jgi:hypothetical protein